MFFDCFFLQITDIWLNRSTYKEYRLHIDMLWYRRSDCMQEVKCKNVYEWVLVMYKIYSDLYVLCACESDDLLLKSWHDLI
jgi:hypothetical protein